MDPCFLYRFKNSALFPKQNFFQRSENLRMYPLLRKGTQNFHFFRGFGVSREKKRHFWQEIPKTVSNSKSIKKWLEFKWKSQKFIFSHPWELFLFFQIPTSPEQTCESSSFCALQSEDLRKRARILKKDTLFTKKVLNDWTFKIVVIITGL